MYFGKIMYVCKNVQMVGMVSLIILRVQLVRMVALLALGLYPLTVMHAHHSITLYIIKIVKAGLVIKHARLDSLLIQKFLMFAKLVMFNVYTVQVQPIIAHTNINAL